MLFHKTNTYSMANQVSLKHKIVVIDDENSFLNLFSGKETDKAIYITLNTENINELSCEDVSKEFPSLILINRDSAEEISEFIEEVKYNCPVCYFNKALDNYAKDIEFPEMSMCINENNPDEMLENMEKVLTNTELINTIASAGFSKTKQHLSLEEKLLYFLNNNPLPAIGFNEAGRICLWNSAIAKITGYKFEEISKVYDPISILYPSPDFVQNAMRDTILKNLNINGFEYEIQCKHDEKRYIQWYNAGIDLPINGVSTWLIGIDTSETRSMEFKFNEMNKMLEDKVYFRTAQLEDALQELRVEIAVRTEAEKELLKAKEEILQAYIKEKQLGQIRSDFITMVSHEYRTPLTVITSSAHLLEKYFKDYNHDKFMLHQKKILNTSRMMVQMMENIIEVNKTDNYIENKRIYFQEYDVLYLIKTVIQKAEETERIAGVVKLISQTDKISFVLDHNLFEKAMFQIIQNAIKFSKPEPKIFVELLKSDHELIISINDNGIGIPENCQSNLFKPFLKCSNAENYPGTGIGLSIAKTCIDAMSGSIILKSKANEGTTFIIKISSQNRL